ncbi:AraC family transcriptional regulator [Sinomonas sp. JGH33]|uniref:AraC family transcriptional regulator n=1 Tax=Sinomonas terricola TaxID=3110330 RepID=A0ABU5TBL8_9MICC|nr:AraC family transcriptional regulator [Sinomonas sp. JGH33]MEA5457081.1 AraC family transcriptional regulator [Sinomonas sp. JGH33]
MNSLDLRREEPERSFLREGFTGQRMSVLPRPRVKLALDSPATANLVVTDCGYFPNARHHGRTRHKGITQTVVLMCVKGSGWVRVDGYAPTEVNAGEAAILPAGIPHAYAASDQDPWTLWWLHVEGPGAAAFLAALNARALPAIRRMADPVRMASLASEVVTWHEKDTTDASLIASSGAAAHLLALLATDQLPGPGVHAAVESIVEHLRNNITARVSVDGLAAMAGLSRSHFAALFKERTGFPVVQFQTQLRMQRARELLDTTNTPIERIAGLVGYDDPFYFARMFKKVHGISPRQYRNHEKG